MAAISYIQPIAVKEEHSSVSHDKGGTASAFARASNLAQADMLLKGTDQYEKWQAIRQKNGRFSVSAGKVAADIVKRNTMLEQAKQHAGNVDWGTFDALTNSIAQHGIALQTSDQLTLASSRPSPLPTNPYPKVSWAQPLPSSKGAVAVGKNHNATSEPAGSKAPAEEMVVNVVCGRYSLTPALIALGNENKIMLPLGEISRILEFNITSDAKTGKAAGWFLSENRTFSLDAVSGQATSEGKALSVPAEHIIRTDDDIYVDADSLSKWFPVDLKFDFIKQSLEVSPREDLPFQTRAARRLSWKDLKASGSRTPRLPRKASEYELVEFPVLDMGGTGTTRNSGSSHGNYYLHAKGDFARMNSELYVSGDEEDPLDTARFTLKREDPDAHLLGPAHATGVAAGDIRVSDFPLVGSGTYERGVRITNESLHRSHEYDSTFFEGSLAPGWDVEVYRNGVLLRHQSVGTDGRYSFEKVPLYYGANNFTLKFYGPQGEVRQEEKQIMVGGEMMKPGELQYELSASQKGEDLLPVDKENYSSNGKGTGRFLGRFEYGLTPRVSLLGGVLSQHAGEKRHNYLHTGLRGSIADSYLTGDLVFDPEGKGYAAQVLGQKKVGPLDVRLRQQFFQDFSATGYPTNKNTLKSRTTLSAFGRIAGEELDVPFSLNFSNSQRESGSENSASANISTRIKNTYLNTSVDYHDWNEESEEADVTGSSSFTSEFKDLRLRGSVNYDLHPEPELTSARVSALRKINDDLSAELAVSHDMDREDKDLTTVSLGANFNNGKYSLSPSVAYNTDSVFTAALSLNVSLGSEPRTGKKVFSSTRKADQGAVSARVFHDKNNNKVFDKGDEPIENAKVVAVQSFRDAVTDKDGIAFVRGLPKNKPTDVALDTTTLEDPSWEPSQAGHSIVPRPGHVEIMDFPVTATGEIDGELSLRRADGTIKELTHAPLQLVDANNDVVAETRSEYDGFYLFEKVNPGEYRVRLEPEFEKNLHVQGEMAPVPITISNEGNVVSGNNLAFVERPSGGPDTIDTIDTIDDTMIALHKKKEARGDTSYAARPAAPATSVDTRIPAPVQETSLDKSVAASSVAPVQKKTTSAPAEQKVSAGAVLPSEPARDAGLAVAEHIAPIDAAASSESVRPDSSSGEKQQYAYHLSSYRSMEKAVQGISYQANKYKDVLPDTDFIIQKTDLGPQKGIWYRVMSKTAPAAQVSKKPGKAVSGKPSTPYTKVVSLQDASRKGVHLTSLKTLEGAKQSIRTLKKTYPEALKDVPFSIVYKDLGQKGGWYRVVAGNFSGEEQAQALSRRIKQQDHVFPTVALKKTEPLTVHTAYYSSLDGAVKGADMLAQGMGTAADELSIRKVELGPKAWYWVTVGSTQRL